MPEMETMDLEGGQNSEGASHRAGGGLSDGFREGPTTYGLGMGQTSQPPTKSVMGALYTLLMQEG